MLKKSVCASCLHRLPPVDEICRTRVRKRAGYPYDFSIFLDHDQSDAGANMELMVFMTGALVEPLARSTGKPWREKGNGRIWTDGLDDFHECTDDSLRSKEMGVHPVITPRAVRFYPLQQDKLIGRKPQDNAQINWRFKREKGPRRDAVVLNSAAAIHIARGISIEDAIRKRRKSSKATRACTAGVVATLTNQSKKIEKFFNRGICLHAWHKLDMRKKRAQK